MLLKTGQNKTAKLDIQGLGGIPLICNWVQQLSKTKRECLIKW
jgi:hypothetical protein